MLFNIIGAYLALTAASSLDTKLKIAQHIINQWSGSSPGDSSRFASKLIGVQAKKGQTAGGKDTPFEKNCREIRRLQHVGGLAYWAVFFGFLACPVALVCLAFDQESLAMKIAAPVVIGGLVVLAFVFLCTHRENADSLFF